MSKDLFSIGEEQLETGMRGFPVGYCTTSSVDPHKGLHYQGIPLVELAHLRPEDIIYLLFHGQIGTEEKVNGFSKELATRSLCKEETIHHIRQLPKKGHPMSLFCAALSIAGMLEETGDYKEDCLNLIARIPMIAAHCINHHAGWEKSPSSNPELGYMENFTQMLNVPNANQEELTAVMKLFNLLHYDHGGGNLSTFVGKAVASGLQGMYGSISAAMSALAGPRHGKANQDCLEFIKLIERKFGENISEEVLEHFLEDRLDNKKLVFGFGHPVLLVEDARATFQYKIAEEKYAENPLVKIALMLRKVGPKVLKKRPKVRNPYPNVDAISGSLLSASQFPYSEYFTVLFGASRSVGIAIQIVYERCIAREGKGTPIIRPKYLYKSLAKVAH